MEKNTKTKNNVGPKGPWFKMPKEITLSSELNPFQYRLLAVLLERDNLFKTTKKLKKYWSSNGWIASHSGMGETKMRKTLKELEKMGFITITRNGSKHKENTFQINWDVINAYRRPKTQEELEALEDLEELEEMTVQEQTYEPPVKTAPAVAPVKTAQTGNSKSSWKQYLKPWEKMDRDPYYIRRMTPEFLKLSQIPFPLPKDSDLAPAKEWYCESNRQFIRDSYFPTLLEMEQSNADRDDFYHYIYAVVLHWVLPYVKEYEDAEYVWEDVVKPDYEEYKKEQLAQKQAHALQ